MGELPVYTSHAHVFTIDPKTKKTWIPSSSTAVEINYFFDPSKNCYRIVSIEDLPSCKKVIINSTLTEKMAFKKTSQKFGQWTDSKQSTIFGLGFNSETDLDAFVEQFKKCVDTMKKKSAPNSGDANSKENSKQELLGLNNNPVNLSGSGRQWSCPSSTSPNLNNNNPSKVLTLESEVERLSKVIEELKLKHQVEIKRLKDDLDHATTGALSSTVDNFKNSKDMKLKMAELEQENKDLKKKLKELSESKSASSLVNNQLSTIMNLHQQMDVALKQFNSYHFTMGQKLSDILTSDIKPPTTYGM